ncbi:MAG TPA: hypothetical protein VFY87_20625 [Geminicoccaceae bacterium]|nr:hypothetical protein [Geminicoccaceae bacterium]
MRQLLIDAKEVVPVELERSDQNLGQGQLAGDSSRLRCIHQIEQLAHGFGRRRDTPDGVDEDVAVEVDATAAARG